MALRIHGTGLLHPADDAGMGLSPSLGAGGLLQGGPLRPGMAQRRDLVLGPEDGTADAADAALRQAGLRAGGILGLQRRVLVALPGNGFSPGRATAGAGVGHDPICHAGGLHGIGPVVPVVAFSGRGFGIGLVTQGALPGLNAVRRTGGGIRDEGPIVHVGVPLGRIRMSRRRQDAQHEQSDQQQGQQPFSVSHTTSSFLCLM